MEFEEAKKAIECILQQYADGDVVKAATVVAAALNEACSEKGYVFMVKIGEAVSSVLSEDDVSDLLSRILGVHCSRK